jgi:outer membrane protein assembly factor BamD
MEVQEVIAEREFRVGRFYYLRGSYPASIARLRSLIDKYPLYSGADEALYLLGQAYEGEIALVRSRQGREVDKAHMIEKLTQDAAEAYSRILTRYPLMGRTADARARLQDLHQPVPRPTRAALAQNKAEEDSRRESSMVSKMLRNFQKHPDVAQAARVGEPTLVDPQVVSATSVVQEAARAVTDSAPPDKNAVSIETVDKGAPPPDQPAPRSDSQDSATPAGGNPASAAASAEDANDLKPNVPADPNELTPNVSNGADQAPAPPQQVNELSAGANGQNGGAAANGQSGDAASSSSADDKEIDAAMSSSKHKKKKGLRKVVPF